ncbi:AAA family ATPase [Photobacterium damselae]|uniref:AAA family ATPase n=1 Tax=Photobacterium damselae TaxID=38293 RepID=UPI002341D8ED|nr:ATP-binding protein [Photobacterium damselae]MDC4167946.1 AAA family ATPase [Photobacterium damselae]
MFLNKLRIMNLWKNGVVELPFDKRVTVLTGINGSGKSSILNIIYDSLDLNQMNISTSKNRLWASELKIEGGIRLQTIILPPVPESKQNFIQSLIRSNEETNSAVGLYSERLLTDIQKAYEDNTNKQHVTFTNRNLEGQGYIYSLAFPKGFTELKQDEINNRLRERPNAFLFQEDRRVMHNLENSNMDLNLEFWSTYSTSIDSRFFYIRDAMQIRESQLDARRSRLLDEYEACSGLMKLKEDPQYMAILRERAKIRELFDLLNSYFIESGKELVKDPDDNKITLKPIDDEKAISWHLLSRGEKTLIYLFFSIFLYKDKVSLFLLDEPDVSLHVIWQERLLNDLTSLAPEHQFIIATHSPSLVMKGWMDNCKTIKVS